MIRLPARFRFVLICLLVLVACFQPSAAQDCTPRWVPGEGTPGLLGNSLNVNVATMWDRDGPGPQTPKLLVAGNFIVAGDALGRGLALYDPDTGAWSTIAPPLSSALLETVSIYSVAVMPNNDLVIGGNFTHAGGVPANNIARWNGSTWSALGDGLGPATVSALIVLPNGDLLAGGSFNSHGGRIARWDGSSWYPLGSGIGSGHVSSIVAMPNGDIIAGGSFLSAGGTPVNNIARWNGTSWMALSAGTNGQVSAMVVRPNGDLIVGGWFTMAAGAPANYVASWDGAAWSPLGSGINGNSTVRAMALLPNGDVAVGGIFASAGGQPATAMARWNGSSWTSYTGLAHIGSPRVYAICVLPGGDLVAAGSFTSADGISVHNIARWNGASWAAMASGMDSTAYAALTMPNGDVIVGGYFTTAGAISASRIARWDGFDWSPLGTGMNNGVRCLAKAPDGTVIAAGEFTVAGGITANRVARWDGTSWSPLGTGVDGQVSTVLCLPNGDVVVGGTFLNAGGAPASRIARWDGSAWSPVGAGFLSPSNPGVFALARLPNGDLVAGGSFTTAGTASVNNIARWDGTAWQPLGSGVNATVSALAVLPGGDLVAGGSFTSAGTVASAQRVARWNGSAWSAMSPGFTTTVSSPGASVSELAVSLTGQLFAGGSFTNSSSVVVNNLARWTGSAWAPVGSGTDKAVLGLAFLPNNDLFVAGGFLTAGGHTSVSWAWYTYGAPTLSQQPSGTTSCPLGGAPVSVAAYDGYGYQWQIATGPGTWTTLGAGPVTLPCGGSAQAVPAGTASTSIVIGPCAGISGYQVRCVVTNICGSVTSMSAAITVNTADFNADGDPGTDADIEAFFACLAGSCCPACGNADFNADGDSGTDADIESFFRVLAGGPC